MNFYGIFRGICINNLDPMARGRVQVRVPAVTGDSDAGWALPCRALGMPAAAPPSVGDSVWVMYEGGDPSRPVVVGTLPQ